MKDCTCGKASCALDRKKGGRCPGPHETPRRDTGAAVPTSSKFAALRRKMAAGVPDLKPVKLPGLPKTPGIMMGATNATPGPVAPGTPAPGASGPTATKISSYQAIRQKLAAGMRGVPLRNASHAAAMMTPADVAAQKAQFGQGAQRPQMAQAKMQPSGGQMFDFNDGGAPAPELAPRPPKPRQTMFPSSR